MIEPGEPPAERAEASARPAAAETLLHTEAETAEAALEEPRRAARAEVGRGPSRTALLLAGLFGFLALAGATGYKAAIKPGRVRPPEDARLRALPPPTEGSEEEEPPRPPPPAAKKTEEPPAAAAKEAPPSAGKTVKKAEGKRTDSKKTGGKKVAWKEVTKTKAKDKKSAEVKPRPKPQPKPALGPPPEQDEIEACINKRKPKLRACADEAAQSGEFVPRGYATAVMKPDGKLTDVWVPGGGSFASCVAQVISGLRCRAYRGDPVGVRYRLR